MPTLSLVTKHSQSVRQFCLTDCGPVESCNPDDRYYPDENYEPDDKKKNTV